MSQQPPRRIPEIRFRVLIIGRANAGKTTILKRVCETTESPVVFRGGKEVRGPTFLQRGEHTIDDALVFSNHRGYIFHDSQGIESASKEELGILQDFIRRKCREKRLRDKLHAIWYCIPMDNQRPGLDLRFLKDICPDKNVPVIAVFTKYDQFRRNVKIDVEDYGTPDDNVSEVGEKIFQEHYLHPLGDVGFVRLEQMHKQNRRCDDLIEMTAAALNEDTVALMFLTVQKGNLQLSVKMALNRVLSGAGFKVEGTERIVEECLFAFPFIWLVSDAIVHTFRIDKSVSGCDASLRFEPADDACPRLSSPPCVHALLSSPLMISIFCRLCHCLPFKITSSGLSGHHLILLLSLFSSMPLSYASRTWHLQL
ncbi:hypothetical protein EDB86DRAFT_2852120 [Lactarius hatsudake]|nr:hypothetical protein EDB86DRAFT_2852120 [Lactarius hatsudake]